MRLTPHLILLWLGQMLSAIGSALHEIALMWIAVEAVGEKAGLVAVAGPIARLLFGLFGGVFADRWDRQRAMVAADLLSAAAVATLSLAALGGAPELWHLAAVAAALGVLESIFGPALQGSLPVLAPDTQLLQRANALLNITPRLARIIGPGVAGVLLALMPISQFFSLDAASFAASALLIRALGRGYLWKSERQPEDRDRGVLGEIHTALQLVRAHRTLFWGIALIGVWNLSSAALMVVGVPLFVREVLGRGPETYGYIMAAYGVGNVMSNLGMLRVRVQRPERLLFAGGLIFGICWLGVAWFPTFSGVLLLAALAAVGGPMTDLMVLLIIQSEIPPQHIGKVYSVRRTVSRAFHGIGLVGAGGLYTWLSVPAGMSAAAAVVASFALVALLRFWNSATSEA